jgi:hypothetical protein
MKYLLMFATALGILAYVTVAQAEIICTNRGCYETGMRIYRNGGVYHGLPVIHLRDDGGPKKEVRIRRYQW